MQVAGEKRPLIETRDKRQRILGGEHYVEKKRRIAPAPRRNGQAA